MAKTLTVRSCRVLDLVRPWGEVVQMWDGPPGSREKFVPAPGAEVRFEQLDEDTFAPATSLTMTAESWRDLGSPLQVTLTIEPGDLLNA
jgi:hypothetical protein